jgi:APA family basic amino acid/polyamine antiporter
LILEPEAPTATLAPAAKATPGRSLGLTAATALVVGEVIGVGIFLTPAGMAKSLGSPLLVLAVWLAMGGTALCGALCYGELAARFPHAGGMYVYLREAFGPRWGFLYGWQCMLVLDPGLTAALAAGLASYVAAPGLAATAVAIGTILGAAGANALGVRIAAGFARVLAFAKIGLLAFIVVWGFAAGLGDASRFLPLWSQRPGSAPLLQGLAGAVLGAFFSFGGWWDLGKVAGEVKDPQRNVPRAFVWGVALTTLVYVATSAVFFYLVPLERVASGETFAAQAGEALFGRSGALVFSGIVVLCVASSLLAYMTFAPRVYYAMARDGVGLAGADALHPRTGAPLRAIAVQATLASLLVAIGRFDQITAYFVFVMVLFLAASVAGLFRLRRRTAAPAAFATPGFPATAFAFLAMTVVVLLLLGIGRPLQAGLGVAVTALGIPVYHWFFARSRSAVPSRPAGG